MARASGQVPEELQDAEGGPPELLEHVWRWFLELSNARAPALVGVAPIAWRDMEAWARLTGHRPSPEEVALLRRLDDAFRAVMAEK